MITLPAETDRHEPLPLDPQGQRLCQAFPYLWQAILGHNDPDPQWHTLTRYPLRPRVLWRYWQDAAQLIGVRFGHQTSYALIDIDHTSPYHPNQDPHALATLRAALETTGICRSLLVRSSWSDGLHLYLPFPEALPTFGVASALKQCLEAQGLTLAAGHLETFPNCKAYALPGSFSEYNAHRLPLQPASGSCLLTADLHPQSSDLAEFFHQWDLAAQGQDLESLKGAIATAKVNRRRSSRPSTVIADWQHDLETEIEQGWTSYGQTNHLLKTLACYGRVFQRLQGDALAEYILVRAAQLPGYEAWCRHRHEISLRASVWAKAAEHYYWPLGSAPTRSGGLHRDSSNNIVPFNQARSEDAQRRIRLAVVQLQEQGRCPATATARAGAIVEQGISLRTLYKHLELWHPGHECKTPVLESVSSDLSNDSENTAAGANPCDYEGFYTKGENMKGGAIDSGSDHLLASSDSFSIGEAGSLTQKRSPQDSELISLSTTHELHPCVLCSNDLAETPDCLSEVRSPQVTSTPQAEFAPVTSISPSRSRRSFEILDVPPEHKFLEVSCVQAMLFNDRAWVLLRLMSLWNQGHHDLIRRLCQLYPEWRLQVTAAGVVDQLEHLSNG